MSSRIRYGYGYPLKIGRFFDTITAFFTSYVAYIERAEADGAVVIPFVPCLFTRYCLVLEPTRSADFILYDSYNVRASLDGAVPFVTDTYICKRYEFFQILNTY